MKLRRYVPAETYDLLVAKAKVVFLRRKYVRFANLAQERDKLRYFFQCWCRCCLYRSSTVYLTSSLSNDTMNLIWTVHFLDTSVAAASAAFQRSLQDSQHIFVQGLVAKLTDAASAGSVDRLFAYRSMMLMGHPPPPDAKLV